MIKIDEQVLKSKIEVQADKLYNKYRPYMDLFEKSLVTRFRKPSVIDYFALGKMLESVDEMIKMCEADGSIGDLGLLPRIAKDVVTVSYGTSPISIIASVQPQEEEIGIVYYKTVRAISSGGNIASGDVIASALGGWETPLGFAVSEVTETIGTGNGTNKVFSATLTNKPVRTGSVVIRTILVVGGEDVEVTGYDLGQDGKIVGPYIKVATINYATGSVNIEFTDPVKDGATVRITYYYSAENITQGLKEINYELASAVIRAKIYALRGVTGLFKSYAMQKRFGIAAEEELAVDLVNAINSEIVGELIKKMADEAPSVVTWNVTPGSGVSYFEHKQSLKDVIAGAERKIIENAKRGNVTFIIAGSGVASVLRTLFGWETVYEGHGMATAHLFGTLDGIPVIRVTDSNVLAPNTAICGYKGPSAFEAPAVFAPYMPLTVTNILPTPHPLVTMRAAAVWAGVEVLVRNFLCKLTVSGTYPYGS